MKETIVKLQWIRVIFSKVNLEIGNTRVMTRKIIALTIVSGRMRLQANLRFSLICILLIR